MNDALTDTLSPEQNLLWQQYLSAEAQRHRPRIIFTLLGFIRSLRADSQEQQEKFAETFCREMADAGRPLPLRQPLFIGVIVPYLTSTSQQEKENTEQRLAYFRSHFFNLSPSEKLLDIPEPLPPMDVLAEAYHRNPDNIPAQDALIQKFVEEFGYAVHEVPSGVLYGSNGATVAGCEEWLDDLALFREVVQKRGVAEKYETAMRYWEFHFRGYANYLTHREQYQNYKEYINQHWQV